MNESHPERALRGFESPEEADKANFEHYRSLTPEQRLAIAVELVEPFHGADARLERVHRVVELGECPVSDDRWVVVQPDRLAAVKAKPGTP
ncbi:MAG: hypothetical protein AAF447_25165 [Myxococcota bacterium]